MSHLLVSSSISQSAPTSTKFHLRSCRTGRGLKPSSTRSFSGMIASISFAAATCRFRSSHRCGAKASWIAERALKSDRTIKSTATQFGIRQPNEHNSALRANGSDAVVDGTGIAGTLDRGVAAEAFKGLCVQRGREISGCGIDRCDREPQHLNALAACRVRFAEENLARAGSVRRHDGQCPDRAAARDEDRAARFEPAPINSCNCNRSWLNHRRLFKGQARGKPDRGISFHHRIFSKASPRPGQSGCCTSAAEEMQAAGTEIAVRWTHMRLDCNSTPGCRCRTSRPTASIRPPNSWPRICGTEASEKPFGADDMKIGPAAYSCRSVPQIPQ